MSTQLVNCPHCNKLLRSDRPLPPGATLRCPECRSGFSAPTVEPEATPPAQRLFGPAFFIASSVSLILGASVIITAILMSGGRKPEEPYRPDDTGAKLAEEQKKLETARLKLEDERRKLELGKLLVDGETALTAGRYDDAEKAFGKARELAPTDPVVVKGLAGVRAGREKRAGDVEETRKRDADRDRLLDEGRKLLGEKQYARAVPVLEAARALAPSDAAVLTTLAEAKAAADRDEGEKKKLADYKARVAAAKTALEGGKFEDAAREAAAALALVPDSEEARGVQKAANAKQAAAGKEEKQNRQVEAKLNRAQASLDAKRYSEAVATLEAALKDAPEDREVTRLLRSARQALDRAKQANARLLAQARDWASRGRYDQAVASATEATRNWPEDEAAVKLLRNAEKLLATIKSNQDAYLTYLLNAEFALSRGRYTDAVTAYQAALQLVPGDVEVMRMLRTAQIGADAMIRYERQLTTATLALRARRYGEALAAFRAAGKLMPDDPAWRKGLSDTVYTQAMQAGQLALNQRKRNEAIAAFEAALAARVADPLAQRGLDAARRLR